MGGKNVELCEFYQKSNKSSFLKIYLETGGCLILTEIQQLRTQYKIIHK